MTRQEILTQLKALIQAHPKGRTVSGFTVYDTAMSDCVFTLGATDPCIEKDYPASFRVVLQLEGPFALPPQYVRNSMEFTFLTDEEFAEERAKLTGLLDKTDKVDEEAREKFVREWKEKNNTRRT